MYLSKLLLNHRDEQAGLDLAVRYDLHRTLANVFPGPRATDQQKASDDYELHHGMLYRVEEPGPDGTPVLVQSVSEPDWTQLPSSYALRVDGPKLFDPGFAEGQTLRFRLVANPIRRVRIDGKKHPRRYALVHPAAKEGVEHGYFDWLSRQAEASGFTIADVIDAPFRLNRKRQVGAEDIAKSRIPHFGVRFDGVLRVTQPEKLIEAIRRGIGPAKAFGFGLLSLAPAR